MNIFKKKTPFPKDRTYQIPRKEKKNRGNKTD